MVDDASVNQITKDIRKENKSLKNRIHSILLDSKFLDEKVIPFFPYPLVPNERCGLWYCKRANFTTTSYFKSTDGHINQWDFSTRRLNFHLIPLIEEQKGIIIIDSTRRGKKIPDALSKTVPIWCAVLNTMILQHCENEEDKSREVLFVPPATVSKSEYERIKNKIPELVEKLCKLDVIDGKKLYEQFEGNLLRPIWIHPGSSILQSQFDPFTGEIVSNSSWEEPSKEEKIIPIVLCTVSYQVQDGVDVRDGFTYVQGAADDHELWSHGLSPQLFWDNIELLNNLELSEEMLEDYVEEILLSESMKITNLEVDGVFKSIDKITEELYLGNIVDGLEIKQNLMEMFNKSYSLVIILSNSIKLASDEQNEQSANAKTSKTNIIKLFRLQSGSKKSSKELRSCLPEICDLLTDELSSSGSTKKPILVCCNNGSDMSIAVILVTLSKFYTQEWRRTSEHTEINKITIRKHLTKVISHLGGRNVNPSRATLNSVNDFLM
ncbi:hypothetical protein TPHA_0I00300 [Tetrapisispora phaffii CBS 4417]|uniref:Initiator tRNA phosphoribosyl transferase n=1 Tax=Tetrapisispora phaffii (strain ATCC 24235 / CBS 4417 / NBRC 1672 / NRRL Y-8282 / UCD 70-5) TaxID=1071381 RepID=G8BXA9_TETPH|nr:hypothetical protein TPHA_0I00300 [Tetrapisispora phaffii CBS 4417]CCE64537.1 hypothetical protein TPHA_0I00300 [Tetrapisispora phaffii CBS 4417]